MRFQLNQWKHMPKFPNLHWILFYQQFFACTSNSTENSLCCNLIPDFQITAHFCTCHNSTALWYVQNFVVITYMKLDQRKTKFTPILNINGTIISEIGPWSTFYCTVSFLQKPVDALPTNHSPISKATSLNEVCVQQAKQKHTRIFPQ